jgi:hypothetical protein
MIIDYATYKRTRQIVSPNIIPWTPPADYEQRVKDARELEDALRRFCEDRPCDSEATNA